MRRDRLIDRNWGLKTAFFFAGISAPFVVASFFLIPDTSRKSSVAPFMRHAYDQVEPPPSSTRCLGKKSDLGGEFMSSW